MNARRQTTLLRDYWPLALSGVLGVWIFRHWYFSSGYITYGDWWIVPPGPTAYNLPTAKLWLEYLQLGLPFTNFNQFYTAFAWFYHLQIGFPIAERILFFWFFPPILLSGFYVLAYSLTNNRLGASVAALVGCFNATTLLPALGGQPNASNSIACTAWCVGAAAMFVRGGRYAWLAAFIIAEAAVSAYDLRWLPLATALALAIAILGPRGVRRARAAALFGAFFLAALLANLYWLLPKVLGSAPSPAPPAVNFNPSWVSQLSVITMGDALSLWNPYFVNTFVRPPLLESHVPWYGYLLPLLCIAAIVIARSRAVAVGACIYFAGAFVTKGMLWPLGDWYLWAFQHLPFFNAYRDPSKFEVLPVVGASILAASGVAALRERRAHAFALAVAVVCVALSAPVLTPHYGALAVTRPFPPAYTALNDRLAADRHFGRVLWLPVLARWSDQTLIHPAIDGARIAQAEFAPWTYVSGSASNANSFVRSPMFRYLARVTAIKYVVVDDSVETDATLGGLGTSTAEIRADIGRLPNWRVAGRFGHATLYENTDAVYAGWTANAAASVTGPLNSSVVFSFFAGRFGIEPLFYNADAPDSAIYDAHVLLDGAPERTYGKRGPSFTDRIAGADQLYQGKYAGDTVMDRPLGRLYATGITRAMMASSLGGISPAERYVAEPSVEPLRFGNGQILQPKYSGGIIVYTPTAAQIPVNAGSAWHSVFWGNLPLNFTNLIPSALRVHVVIPVTGRNVRLFAQDQIFASKAGRIDASFSLPPGTTKIALEGDGPVLFASPAVEAVTGSPAAVRGKYWSRVTFTAIPLYDAPTVRFALKPYSQKQKKRYSVIFELRDRRSGKRYLFVNGAANQTFQLAVRSTLYFTLVEEQPLSSLLLDDALDYLDLTAVDVGSPEQVPFSVVIDHDLRRNTAIERAEPLMPNNGIYQLPRPLSKGVVVLKLTRDDVPAEIALLVQTKSRSFWTVAPVPAGSPIDVATICDLAAPRERAAVRALALWFPAQPADVRQAFVVGTGGSMAQRVVLGGGTLRSDYGTGRVLAALDIGRAGLRPSALTPIDLAAHGTKTALLLATRDRWLVVSDAYDRGWELRDSAGKALTHARAYGILNAWYSRNGFAGRYVLSYAPDEYSTLGFFLGFGALVIVAALGLADALRTGKPQ